jgi:hypothetical protein
MSTFLKNEAFAVPPGTTQAVIQSTIDGKLTAQGWQRVTHDTTNFISDFIPPVSETIGDGKWRQHLRIYYNTADISFSMYDYPVTDAAAQQYRLWSKTAGAVSLSVQIGSETVTYAGTSGSTANDNLYGLFVALKASVAADVTEWNITYLPGTFTSGTVDAIFFERKTITGTIQTFTPNANVNGNTQNDPVLASTPSAGSLAGALVGKYAATIDRSNGFYVYMSIFSRTAIISIKTISNCFGPMFATWQVNADAIAALPPKPSWMSNNPCRIIEGSWGYVNGTAAQPAETYGVRFSNLYMLNTVWNYVTSTANLIIAGNFNAAGGGGTIPGIMNSVQMNGHYLNNTDTHTSSPVGVFAGTNDQSSVGLFDVLGCVVNPVAFTPINGNYYLGRKGRIIGFPLDDVYAAAFYNTDVNEVTCVAGIKNSTAYTLQQALDNSSTYATVLLNTTTGLAADGYVTLGQEVFKYTGLSGGNTLTGVTRAYNSTPLRYHYVGDEILQGVWFIKINGGYMYSGFAQPVAS